MRSHTRTSIIVRIPALGCFFITSAMVTRLAAQTLPTDNGTNLAGPSARANSIPGLVTGNDGLNSVPKRIREGERIEDRTGHFKMAGDRVAFYDKDKTLRLRCLENLALERVARIIGDNVDLERLKWCVTGTITEFHGTNYLLVTRAVLEPRGALSTTGSH